MTTSVDPDRRRSCCQAPATEPHTLDCPELLRLQELDLADTAGRSIPAQPAPFEPRRSTLWRAILTVERVDSTAPEAVRVELVDNLDELPAMVDELRCAAQAILERKAGRNPNLRQLAQADPQTAQASR